MARLTWHGHSCFSLELNDGTRILLDPYLDENPSADIDSDAINRLDFILVSHGHQDHFDDCLPLARRTGATVVSTVELVRYCNSQGIERVHGMNIGGAHDFPFGRLKLTAALHTGSIAGDGSEGFTTTPCGFLIHLSEGGRLYFAGDTALTVDMQLLRGQVDVALLPIGDNFTMGPEDAVRAIEFVEPNRVIPMHYDTWELIRQDTNRFERLVGERANVQVLAPGESLDV